MLIMVSKSVSSGYFFNPSLQQQRGNKYGDCEIATKW